MSEPWEQEGWEITEQVYQRMAHQPAPRDVGRTAEEQAAVAILGRFIPPARAESCARVTAGRASGIVLCDQTGAVQVWYLPVAAYATVLPALPPAAQEDLDLVLQVYDSTTEAIVILLTRSAVQPRWLRANGEMRGKRYPRPSAVAGPAPPGPGRRGPVGRGSPQCTCPPT